MSILNPHSGTSSLTGINRGRSVCQTHEECCCFFPRRRAQAFTLVELLAVVLVIAILAGLTLGMVGYVHRRSGIQTTRSQIAALEAALEMYKSDWGYYPQTYPERISTEGIKEATNNFLLYRALSGTCLNCSKVYLNLPAQQIRTNLIIQQLTICDTWGTPFNYYNSPTTPYAVNNTLPAGWAPTGPSNWYGGYVSGGQVNSGSYDLFSYGPDQYTYVPGAIAFSGGANYAWHAGNQGGGYTNPLSAVDDIANWK